MKKTEQQEPRVYINTANNALGENVEIVAFGLKSGPGFQESPDQCIMIT